MLDSQTSLMLQPQPSLVTQVATLSPVTAYTKSSTHGPSRILCLKLQEKPSGLGHKTKKRSPQAIAETFLKFSPRVVFRTADDATNGRILWVFIDIASTAHLFSDEEGCAREACALAQVLGYDVQSSVADTPSGAQAFISAYPNSLCPPGEERESLKKLSLPLLLHLEGVEAWAKPSQVESILTFFMMIGFKTVGDLAKLSSSSFRERWGATGLVLWQRLNALDRSVISPLVPIEPLEDYVHLDFPITLVSLLLRHSEKSLDYLFARLQGRRLVASRLVFTFHCEYSGAHHRIEIEPNTPSRNQELFATLLENKLSKLSLENPIRDFEVHMIACEEKVAQLDFFEPRVTHRDRLETLFSVLLQSSVKPGLFELKEAIMPEESWSMVAESRAPVRPEDITLRRQDRLRTQAQRDGLLVSAAEPLFVTAPLALALAERSVAYTPAYGDTVTMAPRPSRLLNEPMPLAIEDLERLKILSSTPIERLENGWWEDELPRLAQRRDYYFAVSPEGQCLWIYQDLTTDEYFLHGYFD